MPPLATLSNVSAKGRRSFAAMLSLLLALLGFVVFWAVAIYLGVQLGKTHDTERLGTILLAVAAFAFSAHAVGAGVLLAAPAGKRLWGALANGLALLLMAGLFVVGLAVGDESETGEEATAQQHPPVEPQPAESPRPPASHP